MTTKAVSRRAVLTGAAAAIAAPAVLRATDALASDVTIEISSNFAANTPFQRVVDTFNGKGLGVRAVNRFDGSYEDATAKILASIAAGRPPALMTTGWKFGYYAKRTLGARNLRELDAARAERIIANFRPDVHPLVTIDGALIGVPWAMSTPLTYINMELWRAAGLEPTIPAAPDTDWLYARVRELDRALRGRNTAYRSAIDLSNNEWTSQSFIQNAGGAIIDERGEVGLERAASIRGMEAYCQPAHQGLWIPVSGREQDAAFVSGALAVTTTSSTRVTTYPRQARFEVATARFPGIAGAPRRMNSGGNFLAVYARQAEQANAAMTFLEFCASEEGQRLWSQVGYLNCSRFEVPLVSPQMQPAQDQLADGLTAETIWPGTRGFEAQDVWRRWVTRMLERQSPVSEAMRLAQRELADIIRA